MPRLKFKSVVLYLVTPLVVLTSISFYLSNRERQTQRLIKIVQTGDYYQPDTTGRTYGTIIYAHQEAYKTLCKGANPNTKLNDKTSLIQFAVQRSDMKLAEILKTAGAETDLETEQFIQKWRKRESNQNLCLAVEYGNLQKMDDALRGGADINGKGLQGNFPLQIAVMNSENVAPDMTKALLERGADAHQKVNEELTLIPLALRYRDDLKVIIPLQKAGAPVSPASALAIAVLKNNVSEVRQLLDEGTKIDAIPSRGSWTPLQRAASKGFDEVVELLLEQGADFRLKSSDKYAGCTALAIAEINNSNSNMKGFERTIELLEHAEKIGFKRSLTIKKHAAQ